MATGRDDFVIAIRSAFLKKKDKQKFSLLTLIFLSIFVIVLSNFNFKAIKIIKSSINEVIYRSSFLISAPENYFKNLKEIFKVILSMYGIAEIKSSDVLAYDNMIKDLNQLVHFGWKKEAIPVTKAKKSIISRIFDSLFS